MVLHQSFMVITKYPVFLSIDLTGKKKRILIFISIYFGKETTSLFAPLGYCGIQLIVSKNRIERNVGTEKTYFRIMSLSEAFVDEGISQKTFSVPTEEY